MKTSEPLDGLLPHEPPARLVTAVQTHDERSALCTAVVPGDSAWATGRGAPAHLGLEIAAQAAAVHGGLAQPANPRGPRPEPGALVGVRRARFHRAWLPLDAPLEVAVRRTGSAGPLAIYDADVAAAGTMFVEATLSVMTSDT